MSSTYGNEGTYPFVNPLKGEGTGTLENINTSVD